MRYEIKAEQLDKIIAKQDELIKYLIDRIPIEKRGTVILRKLLKIAALKEQESKDKLFDEQNNLDGYYHDRYERGQENKEQESKEER